MKLLGAATIALTAVLAWGAIAPAEAGVHVFVGAGYPYPYYYYHPAPYPYWGWPGPYPYYYSAYPGVPPPGWVPGRWSWRYDASGRPHRVWTPPHLR